MQKEIRKSSDIFSEKLIPIRVTITRKRGNFSYVFEIDGFKGEKTGEIHYKGSEVSRVEKRLASNNPIYSFTTTNVGLIISFETPMAVASESISTGTLAPALKSRPAVPLAVASVGIPTVTLAKPSESIPTGILAGFDEFFKLQRQAKTELPHQILSFV